MNPRIALALCLIFIIVALVIDHQRRRDLTGGYLIVWLWVMIVLSRFVSQWVKFGQGVGAEEGASYEGNALDRIVFIGLIGLAAITVVTRRRIVWSQLASEYRWLFGYFLYCGFSILWSDFPLSSFKVWIKDLGGFVMALVIMSENNPFEALQSMMRRCTLVLVPLSVAFVKYFPELGRYYNRRTGQVYYHGVSVGKNGLGALCLICGFFLFAEILRWFRNEDPGVRREDKLLTIALACMIGWLMMMADSMTSVATLMVGMLLMVAMGFPSLRRAVKAPVGIGFWVVVFALVVWLVGGFEIALNMLGRDVTFTGRTEIWEKVLSVKVNPIIGVGYESFWLGEILKMFGHHYSPPNQSHNGYIEIYVNLGIIGLVFVAGIFVSFARKAIRSMGPSLYSGTVQLSFFLIFWIYNMTEYGFRPLNSMWLVFLMLGILCSETLDIQIVPDNKPSLQERAR